METKKIIEIMILMVSTLGCGGIKDNERPFTGGPNDWEGWVNNCLVDPLLGEERSPDCMASRVLQDLGTFDPKAANCLAGAFVAGEETENPADNSRLSGKWIDGVWRYLKENIVCDTIVRVVSERVKAAQKE